jgi:hypothetical protein
MLQTALTMIPQEVFAAHRGGQAFVQDNPLTRTLYAGVTAHQSPEGSEVMNTDQIDLSESPQFVQGRPKRLADETDTVQKVAMGQEINRAEQLGDAPHLVPGRHNRLGETIDTSHQFWIGQRFHAEQHLRTSQPQPQSRKDLGAWQQEHTFSQETAFSNVLESSLQQTFAIPSPKGTNHLGQHNIFNKASDTARQVSLSEGTDFEWDLHEGAYAGAEANL